MRFLVSFLLLPAAFAAGVCTPASAQSVGVKAGVTRMDVRFDDSAPFDARPKTGVVAGGVVTLDWRWGLSLQGEGLFVQRSVEIEEVITDRLRYVEVPIAGRFRVVSGPGYVVHALAGANIAFLLDATEMTPGAESDISEAVRSRDFAAIVGAVVEVGPRLTVDVRYLHGMSKLYRAPEFGAMQRGIEITAGWTVWR
jgi:hypothetical protein